MLSPNYIFIIQYYLIGGKLIKIEDDNIQFFLYSYIKKNIPNKNLNIELHNYQEWFQAWNKLKDKLNKEELNFNDFVKYSVFNNIMKNGTNKKFSKISCFGFKLSSKINLDTCHIVFSLEDKGNDLVRVGVKVIPRRNRTLQTFSFYNSTYPIQPYTLTSDPIFLDRIISINLDIYNTIEIDEHADFINFYVERKVNPDGQIRN